MMSTSLSTPVQPAPALACAGNHQQLATPIGCLIATWTPRGLYACRFASQLSAAEPSPPTTSSDELHVAWQRELARAFEKYFEEGVFAWDLHRLDWTGISPFRQRVLTGCYSIAAGSTLSYGQLAVAAGRPGAARAVGSAMATNRWPIVVPCHRVIGARGAMCGYSGTGGLTTKRYLLDLELRLTGRDPKPGMEPLFDHGNLE
jgi:methylated-DNA-[protein]-cysteine S-methyltransferase